MLENLLENRKRQKKKLISILNFVQRHRLVNEVVKEKLEGDFVHALSIETKSPAQWNENYVMDSSPNCRGGFGK